MSSPLIRRPTVPIRPTVRPAARRPASIRYVVVVLPDVPVTPTTVRRSDGRPYTVAATSPRTLRGSGWTSTAAEPASRFSCANPSASVSTAMAPRSTASGKKRAPCVVAPGSAAKRSPGRTSCARRVTPVICRSDGVPPSAGTAPTWAVSSDNGTPATEVGRSAAGTSITSHRAETDCLIGHDTTQRAVPARDASRRPAATGVTGWAWIRQG